VIHGNDERPSLTDMPPRSIPLSRGIVFANCSSTSESAPILPAEFGKLIADDTEKWGKVIRAGNIKLE
jgi:hypothetical protein